MYLLLIKVSADASFGTKYEQYARGFDLKNRMVIALFISNCN